MTHDPTRKSLEEIEDARMIAEKLTVLAQPHRLGDRSDMTDPLGMFVRMHCHHTADGRRFVHRRLYDAGWKYFRLVYRWRRAKGIPNPVRIPEMEKSSGGELENETVDDWGKQIKRCENTMKCSGLPGFEAAQKLVLHPFEFPELRLVPPVRCAITNLAIEMAEIAREMECG